MKQFARWLKELDNLLRGSKTTPQLLARGTEHLEVKPLLVLSLILGVIYGIFMGLYAILTRDPACWEQSLATSLKVPALFFLTLIVTFPSLYVFGALLGAPLGPLPTFRVILCAVAVNLAVLASFGPITGFFTLNTTSYAFIKLLNVFFFAVAGLLGLGFLLKIMQRLEQIQAFSVGEGDDPPGASGAARIPKSLPWWLRTRSGATSSGTGRIACFASGSSFTPWSGRRWGGCFAPSSARPRWSSRGFGRARRTSSLTSCGLFEAWLVDDATGSPGD